MPVLRTRRRARRRAAFTLIEMMICLVIIGIMAMVVGPPLGEMRQSLRQTTAAMDLVRLGRSARAQARTTGLAHLLRYNGGPNGVGLISVHVGMNRSCLMTPWALSYVAGNLAPRQFFDMDEYNPALPGHPVRANSTTETVIMTEAVVGTTVRSGLLICYEPGGTSYYNENGDDAAATAALIRQDIPIVVRIRRHFGSTSSILGRNRIVIFPPSGSARSQ